MRLTLGLRSVLWVWPMISLSEVQIALGDFIRMSSSLYNKGACVEILTEWCETYPLVPWTYAYPTCYPFTLWEDCVEEGF